MKDPITIPARFPFADRTMEPDFRDDAMTCRDRSISSVAQFVPYASSEVDWRGHRARLDPGTIMLPVGDAGFRAA